MQRSRSRSILASIVWSGAVVWGAVAAEPSQVDVLIRNGEIYDGSGGKPYRGDIAIRGDRIVAIGPRLAGYRAAKTVEAGGLAVTPGFINVLSWAPETLIQDGRGMSDILQGVTLELFGEGDSMGPFTPRTREQRIRAQTDIKYPIEWTTLSEYLEYLVKRGVSPNVASSDHATFERPHQLATGVSAVFVNGVQVVRDGKHTNAKPGQVVHGPGWTGWSKPSP